VVLLGAFAACWTGWSPSRPAIVAITALLALLAPVQRLGEATAERVLGPCSWSYFGDARSVAHGGHVFTGCVDPDGDAIVEEFDTATARRRLATVVSGLESDDHNNPSLVFFRGRLLAFSAPHSGYAYPRDRHSTMRYRVSARPWGIGDEWGPLRTVPLATPPGCRLGYSYPNPVVAGGRLYLFMRGPCWEPYFTSTADGRHWAAPRTLLRAPTQTGFHRVRPYAKYSDAPDGSILMAFSDGHPASYPSSLGYVRFRDGRFFDADGRVVATLADLPLRFDQLDAVQPYTARAGRAWPMDVAPDANGAAVIVFSSLVGMRDTFRYARWDGRRWRTHDVATAGRTLFTYHSSGITLDHADPSWLVLSRTIAGQNEIEARHTTDGGRSWRTLQLTHRSDHFNIRPAIPRGLAASGPLVVVYVAGAARSYRDFGTRVAMRFADRDDMPDARVSPASGSRSSASGTQRSTWPLPSQVSHATFFDQSAWPAPQPRRAGFPTHRIRRNAPECGRRGHRAWRDFGRGGA
jgi:hypothetical protein